LQHSTLLASQFTSYRETMTCIPLHQSVTHSFIKTLNYLQLIIITTQTYSTTCVSDHYNEWHGFAFNYCTEWRRFAIYL